MPTQSAQKPAGLARIFAWRRVRVALGGCLAGLIVFGPGWQVSRAVLIVRLLFVSFSMLLAFGVFERWPTHLPRWIARWGLQVAGVAFVVPFAAAIAYTLTTLDDPKPWFHDKDRLGGYSGITIFSVLIGPWIAVAALLRQIKDEAINQALTFEFERNAYECKATEARLRPLQAQVESHFLFNTLANVRELVDARSPQASSVLNSLIAYLRAAVPRLHEPATTLGQELELVRAYLDVMHMRMPDRLQFSLHADEAALPLFCPSMTLLTLVENAVRHGIDPSEQGGRIDVRVRVRDGRCRIEVIDTGVGLKQGGAGLGTGLANLRERLQLAFGADAQVHLSALAPHGTAAEVEIPARGSAA